MKPATDDNLNNVSVYSQKVLLDKSNRRTARSVKLTDKDREGILEKNRISGQVS